MKAADISNSVDVTIILSFTYLLSACFVALCSSLNSRCALSALFGYFLLFLSLVVLNVLFRLSHFKFSFRSLLHRVCAPCF